MPWLRNGVMRTSQYSSVCSCQLRPIDDSRRNRSSAASSCHRHIAIWRRGSTRPIVKPSLWSPPTKTCRQNSSPPIAASRRRATNRLRAATRGERNRKTCVEATGTIAQANRSPGGHTAPERQTARARRAVLPGGRCGCLALCGEKVPYLVQLMDQELRLQLDLVGSIEPLLVLEQAQLQLDRLQLERLQLDRLHRDLLHRDLV